MKSPTKTFASLPISPLGYTVAEASRVLGISRQTVLRLVEEGSLEKKQITGTRARITMRSLNKLVRRAAAARG